MSSPHYHPLHKLCYVSQSDGFGHLLAATGPLIVSLDLKNGGVLSRWPSGLDSSPRAYAAGVPQNGDVSGRGLDEDSPSKRRKLSLSYKDDDGSGASSTSIEFVSERAKGQRRKKKNIVQSPLPNVSHITSTLDGKHIIAATSEDKCVRVFELDSQARLMLLSERCMPKRLCGIALTTDQKVILTADKFGDVYALPLHPSRSSAVPPPRPRLEAPAAFKPSATELTVHTKGNREALRQQQLQKASIKKKQEPTFEHKLILGHVSLLTDLVVSTDASKRQREYIVTADRDEHIRISRGIPQVHVINNYCLGHSDFVSKLCNIPRRPQYLISGGGEPSIRIWDWLQGGCIANISLANNVKLLVEDSVGENLPESEQRRAVSSIKAMCVHSPAPEGFAEANAILIMVALEGVPGVFTYLFEPEQLSLKLGHICRSKGNVLDIALIEDRRLMLLSVDNIHLPLSTKQARAETLLPIIEVFQLGVKHHDGERLYEWQGYGPPPSEKTAEKKPGTFYDIASKLERTLQSAEKVRHEIEIEGCLTTRALNSPLGEFLYGLENLRKKSHGNGDVQEAEEAEPANAEEV